MIEKLYQKVAKVLNKPTKIPDYDKEFFKKYPQFVNIRYVLVNFDNLTGNDAVTKYARYMKTLNQAGFEKNVPYIMESLRFIKGYCRHHKISIDSYPSFVENGRVTESFWIHLKDRKISPYATIFFPNIAKKILTCDRSEYKYYLENIEDYQKLIIEMSSNETKTRILKKILN